MTSALLPSRRNLLAACMLSLATGCDSSCQSGARDISPGAGPPVKSAAYTSPEVRAWEGQPIERNVLVVQNFSFARGLAVPSLPTGLELDPATGDLIGTPEVPLASELYSVNVYENQTTIAALAYVDIEVFPAGPPTGLVYTPAATSVIQGALVTPLVPTVSGGVAEFTVAPPLPTGLVLDAWTGVISGRPTSLPGTTQHVVTATNPYGSDDAQIELTVIEALGVNGYAVIGVGELTVDVFAGREEGAAPIDTLDGAGNAGVAAAGTPDGEFVFVALSDGFLYSATRDPRTGRTGELVQRVAASGVEQLLVSGDGEHLVVVGANTVTRYTFDGNGALGSGVTIPTGLTATAALFASDDVLVLGSSFPGRLAVFEVWPDLAPRGGPVDVGPEVTIAALERFDEAVTIYAATSTYDIQAHTSTGAVRRFRISTAGVVAAGDPALIPLQSVTVGGQLTDLHFVPTIGTEGDLFVTDGTNGRLHKLDVDWTGSLFTNVVASTTVGGRPVAVEAGFGEGLIGVLDELGEELAVYDVSSGSPDLRHRTRTRRQPVALAPLYGSVPGTAPIVADEVFILSTTDATLHVARTDLSVPGGVVLSPHAPVTTGAGPVAVAASDEAPFVYTANRDDASVSVFSYNESTMALTLVATEPLSPGSRPVSLALSPSGRHLVVIDENGRALGFQVAPVAGTLTGSGSQALTGDLSEASVRSDALGRYFYVAQPNAQRITTLVLGLPAGFPVFQGTEATLVAPSDVWLPFDGRFAYALDRELGRVASFTVRAFDGALTPNGTALSIPGAPARVVTDVGTERMTAENTAAMVVFDPQGERAIPVARNGASGIVLGTQPFAPTAALPAEATAIATLSRATRAEGATLVVTSDDGVSGRLTSFGQDAGGAWVQASSFAIGRGPHVLATARTVR